jgi:hypothetical protein
LPRRRTAARNLTADHNWLPLSVADELVRVAMETRGRDGRRTREGAVVAHLKLGALAVELGLGDVASVRKPARVLQTSGEHRGDEEQGSFSIVATGQAGVARI